MGGQCRPRKDNEMNALLLVFSHIFAAPIKLTNIDPIASIRLISLNIKPGHSCKWGLLLDWRHNRQSGPIFKNYVIKDLDVLANKSMLAVRKRIK